MSARRLVLRHGKPHGKTVALPARAPFAGLCRSLARRQGDVTADFYVGGVLHLARRYARDLGDAAIAMHAAISGGRAAIDDWSTERRLDGDVDADALGSLLLTLSDEQIAMLRGW